MQQIFIENSASGTSSVLWRCVGGQDRQGPCSWGACIRWGTQTENNQTQMNRIFQRRDSAMKKTQPQREGFTAAIRESDLGKQEEATCQLSHE